MIHHLLTSTPVCPTFPLIQSSLSYSSHSHSIQILSFSHILFPFYLLLVPAAELYHQYHDGFMMGEQYPESYNDLAKKAFAQGRLQRSGCPDTNF